MTCFHYPNCNCRLTFHPKIQSMDDHHHHLQSLTITSLTLIGFILLLKRITTLLNWIWIMFFRHPKNLLDYGAWAVITGPTDGIGRAIAFELASKGLNLVLVGRNPSKLTTTAGEITSRFGTETKIVVVDFAAIRGAEILEAVTKGIEGLDVGILFNNAGICYPFAKFFDEVDPTVVESVLRVNMEAPTWVIRAVVPAMLRKGKGAVVNIGSGSSVVVPSYPLVTVYAATKARYLAMLSRSLSLEYKQYGIDIQCQIPLVVATKMTKMRKSNIIVPSTTEYAKASLRFVGYEEICCPYWSHYLQWTLLNILPDAFVNWLTFRYLFQQRARAIAKAMARSSSAIGL
ncbi:Very-long-chain 3-oxoacyl-CoA reductase 1 [Linum perenne]